MKTRPSRTAIVPADIFSYLAIELYEFGAIELA